ncbi:MAG: hypothetical protein Q7R95_00755 [bacterium]|nr:hypothetical protein [bacterium]
MKTIKIKIAVIIILALIITNFVVKDVFIADTPRIRTNFIAYMSNKYITVPSSYISYLIKNITIKATSKSLSKESYPYPNLRKKMDELSQTAAKQIAPGVYARDEGKISLVTIDISQMNIKKIEATDKNGKKWIIDYPADKPVTKEFIDMIINK